MASEDRPVPGVRCPKCGGQVVYNGNYFCEHFNGDCQWALSHGATNGEPIGRTDRRMWAEIQEALGLNRTDT